MITTKDIYDKTSNGLDIILYFYPQAREVVDKKNTPFKIRDSDDTPSAFVKEIKGIWRVTDFGQSDTALSPIDICMQEKGLKFNEAIYWLAKEFDVSGDVVTFEKNRAKFDRRPAKEGEIDGQFLFKAKNFSDAELKLLGPRVKDEHCELLGWISLEYYQKTNKAKDGSGLITTTVSSTDTYPIFMRKCVCETKDGFFYKIYQPLNPDKAYRFFYQFEKPQKYINGLEELKLLHKQYNDQEEKIWKDSNPEGEYKEKKLPEAFVCSGERDALCIKAHNYIPLWFNSETYNLTEPEYKQIMKFVEKLYNIPDIDDTGIKRGKMLATRYIEIFTIWLPKKLKEYRDNRRKPRKDFRDYCEIWPEKQDLKNLMEVAKSVKFWEYKPSKGRMNLEINSDYVSHFLYCNGFATLSDKNSKSGKMFVHVNGNIVRQVEVKDIRAFFRRFATERYLNVDIRNLINNSTRLNADSLNDLDEIQLDFTDFTPTSQYFFFPNNTFEVFGDRIIEIGKTNKHYVWENEVIPHRVTLQDPAFNITQTDDDWDIEIRNLKSNYFKFLINASRIHWRKELEDPFLADMYSEEALRYRRENHFNIAGPNLSDDQIYEQKMHLINKIFTIGYLLHRQKSEHRAWCVFAMDNKVSNSDESNGGSGKSACLKTLRYFMNTETLSGRNPKLTENAHIYENVSEYTDLILIDDADKYLPFGFFFDSVTGEIIVNPKFARSYTIPFERAAKFAITSNFTPDRTDGSTERRLLYMVFSDYYHQKTNYNDYYETRTIHNDFKKDLFRDQYTEEEWNDDINFCMQCCKFYLSTIDKGVKINPPMQNVTARTLRSAMTDIFYDWAQVYFGPGSENCDCMKPKSEALKAFSDDTKQNRWTMHKFSKALKAYCKLADHIISYNPVEFCNNEGRIIRKIDKKTTEMIFIQTKETIDYASIERIEQSGEMPF